MRRPGAGPGGAAPPYDRPLSGVAYAELSPIPQVRLRSLACSITGMLAKPGPQPGVRWVAQPVSAGGRPPATARGLAPPGPIPPVLGPPVSSTLREGQRYRLQVADVARGWGQL